MRWGGENTGNGLTGLKIVEVTGIMVKLMSELMDQ